MGTSKILIDGVGIDLTGDTVAANKMLNNTKAHDANGDSITGSIPTKTSSDMTVSGATVTAPSGYYASSTSKSVATGTAGTPVATKGTVTNNSISITPSVTNTTGYISGSTKTGTAVTVSASDLVSGTLSITSNGSKTVTNYKTVSVNVPDYLFTAKARTVKILLHLFNWSTGAKLSAVGMNVYLRTSGTSDTNRTKVGSAYSDSSGNCYVELITNSSGTVLGISGSRGLGTYKWMDFDPISTSYTWDTSVSGKVRNFKTGTNATKYSRGGWDDAQIGTGYANGVCIEFDCYLKAT